ncbi:MAG: YbjN domain-containing protein [Kineosporiaceae bacterium]
MTASSAAERAQRSAAARAVVEAWLAASGLEHELGARPGEYVVKLPGETKLATTASVLVGDQSLSVSAFVVRRPDENHEAFYRWLLARNLRLPGIAFALDSLGDVFLVGKLPLAAVTDDAIDHLLGAVLSAADSSFNDLLVLGFLEAMRREWRWRIDRGESTRNLDAFKHLLQDAAPAADGPRETHATDGGPHPNG